jgi:hypothetical protein
MPFEGVISRWNDGTATIEDPQYGSMKFGIAQLVSAHRWNDSLLGRRVQYDLEPRGAYGVAITSVKLLRP